MQWTGDPCAPARFQNASPALTKRISARSSGAGLLGNTGAGVLRERGASVLGPALRADAVPSELQALRARLDALEDDNVKEDAPGSDDEEFVLEEGSDAGELGMRRLWA